jgi:hypothetical protein
MQTPPHSSLSTSGIALPPSQIDTGEIRPLEAQAETIPPPLAFPDQSFFSAPSCLEHLLVRPVTGIVRRQIVSGGVEDGSAEQLTVREAQKKYKDKCMLATARKEKTHASVAGGGGRSRKKKRKKGEEDTKNTLIDAGGEKKRSRKASHWQALGAYDSTERRESNDSGEEEASEVRQFVVVTNNVNT